MGTDYNKCQFFNCNPNLPIYCDMALNKLNINSHSDAGVFFSLLCWPAMLYLLGLRLSAWFGFSCSWSLVLFVSHPRTRSVTCSQTLTKSTFAVWWDWPLGTQPSPAQHNCYVLYNKTSINKTVMVAGSKAGYLGHWPFWRSPFSSTFLQDPLIVGCTCSMYC